MGQAPENPKIPGMFFSTWQSVPLTGKKSKICFFSPFGASSIVGLYILAFSQNGFISSTRDCLQHSDHVFWK